MPAARANSPRDQRECHQKSDHDFLPQEKVRLGFSPSKVETNLCLHGSASRLRIDLTKGAGIDTQIRSSRRRMIEYVARIHTQRQILGFRNAKAFLDVGIEIPAAGSLDRSQTETARLAGPGIFQNDISIGIGKRCVRAELGQVRGNGGASRILNVPVLLSEEVSENVARIQWPDNFAFAGKRADDIGSSVGASCVGRVERTPAGNIQRRSRGQIEDCAELPAFDQPGYPA